MKPHAIGFRPTSDLREELEAVARAEDRNLSNMIIVLLREALAARKGE